MSYDIRLNVYSDEPLPEQRLREALDLLRRYGARPSDRLESFSVRWDDGAGFALYSRSLAGRPGPFCALLCPLGDLGQQFCDFTFDFASAVGCAICPDVVPPLVLVVPAAMLAELPQALDRDGIRVRVSSPVALRNALAERLRVEEYRARRYDRENDDRANETFPWRQMSPERYVALHRHLILCFSMDRFRYRDPDLGAWVRRLGELLRVGEDEMEGYRRQHLTPEEYHRVRAEIAHIDEHAV